MSEKQTIDQSKESFDPADSIFATVDLINKQAGRPSVDWPADVYPTPFGKFYISGSGVDQEGKVVGGGIIASSNNRQSAEEAVRLLNENCPQIEAEFETHEKIHNPDGEYYDRKSIHIEHAKKTMPDIEARIKVGEATSVLELAQAVSKLGIVSGTHREYEAADILRSIRDLEQTDNLKLEETKLLPRAYGIRRKYIELKKLSGKDKKSETEDWRKIKF